MGLRISKVLAERLSGAGVTVDADRPMALADLRAARALAAELGRVRGAPPLAAGRLKAAIDLANVVRRKLEEYFRARPDLLRRLLEVLIERSSEAEVRAGLAAFEGEFLVTLPGARATAAERPKAELGPLLLEAVVVWAMDANPAIAPVARELEGGAIWERPEWRRLIGELSNALEAVPPLDGRSRSLGESLRAPAISSPDALPDQLRHLLDEGSDLSAGERQALVGSLDLIAEEEAPRFPPGPGPVELPDYDDFEDEAPRYSADLDWMEPLVLIAKNSYVWLDQLSRGRDRPITRLDEIPERELDRLAEWGITGLWLIGVWERSAASARIKRELGNPDALASAYSLRDYAISRELGGSEAVEALAERAAERGIRLAADMVPNHMGIDSSWVIERPELFLSVPECPFPAYTFEGPDLSPDPGVGIFLEDHYWDRSDAAVVFKRVDRRSGEVRYVYHGNDGTSTPWNDTAQLDYLNPSTRRAVMHAILGVAERFPIIRFDAAMTLARRHVQRLWYPEPGGAGAVPSRSEHALSRSEFKRAMPEEFWREVVDRVAADRPETLLLAEAFWLMEGYFVRSLGMHRVYNSAFMNLLRDGETDKLRRMIRETVAFDPEILKRFVNFLSNPDEASAVAQFGTGDRYFGACVALATLPGLPMIAHGQLEGLSEKYGMEFRRARLDERPDPAVVRRHRRQIVPLLRRRDRFAGVAGFRLLDLVADGGEPNGNVLAYANGTGVERSIVIFNNSADRLRGRLAPLAGLHDPEPGAVYRFRDRTTGLHFLAPAAELGEAGLKVDLAPFESRVLLDFRPVLRAVQEPYLAVSERLAGRGARDLEVELQLVDWLPLIQAVSERMGAPAADRAAATARVERRARALRDDLDRGLLRAGLARLDATATLERKARGLPWPKTARVQSMRERLLSRLAPGSPDRTALDALIALSAIREAFGGRPFGGLGVRLLEELLGEPPGGPVLGATPSILGVAIDEGWIEPSEPPGSADLARLMDRWVRWPDAASLLGLNRHDGQDWVRQEALESFLGWRALTALCGRLLADARNTESQIAAIAWLESVDLLRRLFERAGYALGPVRTRLTGSRRAAGPSGREPGGRRRRKRRRKRRRPSRAR